MTCQCACSSPHGSAEETRLLSTDTGAYAFPPNPNYSNVLKVAVHGPGYANLQPSLSDPAKSVSTPRTRHYGGGEQLEIPDEASQKLRALLRTLIPSLADHDWEMTRLCWYADTQGAQDATRLSPLTHADSHWLLDFHPTIGRLFVCTGDSGHGAKFIPTMGDLIVSALSGTLPPVQRQTWAWSRRRDWRESEDMRGDLSLARRPLPPGPAVGR